MTIIKSNCLHNSAVSSSSRLITKIKPLSVLGLMVQSSNFVLKSINGLQKSFFASNMSNGFKQFHKPLTIIQPPSTEKKRICGPMELRGIELIMKFGSIVKNIDEQKLIQNQNVLEDMKSMSSGTNPKNESKILPTSKVVSAPASKSYILSEILEASKLRNERRSKSVSLDALAAKEVNDILPSEDKHSGTQSARKEVVEATGATLKLPGTSTQRPAMFSAFDLKSVQLKKTDSVRSGPSASISSSSHSPSGTLQQNRRKFGSESPLNDLGKKKFKISDVLNVKLRPVKSRNSNGHKKFGGDIQGSNGLQTINVRQTPLSSQLPQSLRVPPMSMHSALKAALAKKFDKAVIGSNIQVDEAGAESPMSQW